MGATDGNVIGLTKIHDSGPVNSKYNIVLVAEGYTAAQQSAFDQHCEDFKTALFQKAPFSEEQYACALNIYRLNVASTESGADKPNCADGGGTGTMRATYFDASYCWDGNIQRLLSANSSLVQDTVEDYLPEWNQILVIVNDTEWGGAGGSVGVTSVAAGWEGVALHEWGHSGFNLADEYEYWSNCDEEGHDNAPGGEPAEPNVTANPDRNTTKWAGLINAGTPVPTLSNPDCGNCSSGASPVPAGTVGIFEGAKYYHCGYFRPEISCHMRSIGPAFCAVCQQAIRAVLQPYADAGSITLNTPVVTFNDIPQGVTTVRAASWDVDSCLSKTFRVVSGPTNAAFQVYNGSIVTSQATSGNPRTAYLWFRFTGGVPGSNENGTVTIRCDENNTDYLITLTANSVVRPTVAVQFVFDQSGSMMDITSLGRQKQQVLRDAAAILPGLVYDDTGVGVNTFDHDAYPVMDITPAGPAGIGLGRINLGTAISGYAANPAGMTAVGDGIQLAKTKLDAVGGYDQKAMIVFTDGMETAPLYINDVAGSVLNERVFAIGLGTGDQVDTAKLEQLTGNTGGYLLLTGILEPDDQFLLAKYYLQVLAGVTNNDIVVDPEGYLPPNTVVRIPFTMAETDIELTAVLLSDAPWVIQYGLETPAGDFITPAMAGPDPTMEFTQSGKSAHYRLSLPSLVNGRAAREGVWHMVMKIDDRSFKRYLSTLDNYPDLYRSTVANGIKYNASAYTWSNLSMTATVTGNSYEPGAALTVRALLTEYGAPLFGTATVRAEVTHPDGTKSILPLLRAAQGEYRAVLIAALPGVYGFRILANGTTNRGLPFTREQYRTAAVWRGGDHPPQTPGGGAGTGWGDDWCRLLECLIRNDFFTAEFFEQMKKKGLNGEVLLKCLMQHCRDANQQPGKPGTATNPGTVTNPGSVIRPGVLTNPGMFFQPK